MKKISGQELAVAIQKNLSDVAECNGDGWVYEVGTCTIHQDGSIRVAVRTIIPEDEYDSWDGTEGNINDYDTETLEEIAEDIMGHGPSYQGGSKEEVDNWVCGDSCQEDDEGDSYEAEGDWQI